MHELFYAPALSIQHKFQSPRRKITTKTAELPIVAPRMNPHEQRRSSQRISAMAEIESAAVVAAFHPKWDERPIAAACQLRWIAFPGVAPNKRTSTQRTNMILEMIPESLMRFVLFLELFIMIVEDVYSDSWSCLLCFLEL